MIRKIAILIFLSTLFLTGSSAQTNAGTGTSLTSTNGSAGAPTQTTEAGAYEKKSVSYINKLWLVDNSLSGMSEQNNQAFLNVIQSALTNRRFDYNPLSDDFTKEFSSCVGESDSSTEDSVVLKKIASCMEQTIVPKILEIVNLQKEARAANLTTEQQRNSFFTDKTKSSGITMDQINKVMNSAFIYMPMIRNLETSENGSYFMSADVGIIWFRIVHVGDSVKAVVVLNKFKKAMAYSSPSEVDYKMNAFKTLAKVAARNLLVLTQQIPEFKLSAQVLEKNAGSVKFELGKNEGLKIGDKFRIVEATEQPDGSVTQKNRGWVAISSVADSNSKGGYKSKAKIVSGRPYTGEVLSEFPRLPLDISLIGRSFYRSWKSDTALKLYDSTVKLAMPYGAGLQFSYNIGPKLKLRQFFFNISAAIGFGSASGFVKFDTLGYGDNLDIDSMTLNNAIDCAFDASFTLKLPFRRLALAIQPTFGYHLNEVYGKSTDSTYYRLDNSAFVVGANAGLEFALAPQLAIGVGAGYQLLSFGESFSINQKYGATGKWAELKNYKQSTVDRNGLTFQVYITYCPPALPFDPLNMSRGLLSKLRK